MGQVLGRAVMRTHTATRNHRTDLQGACSLPHTAISCQQLERACVIRAVARVPCTAAATFSAHAHPQATLNCETQGCSDRGASSGGATLGLHTPAADKAGLPDGRCAAVAAAPPAAPPPPVTPCPRKRSMRSAARLLPAGPAAAGSAPAACPGHIASRWLAGRGVAGAALRARGSYPLAALQRIAQNGADLGESRAGRQRKVVPRLFENRAGQPSLWATSSSLQQGGGMWEVRAA